MAKQLKTTKQTYIKKSPNRWGLKISWQGLFLCTLSFFELPVTLIGVKFSIQAKKLNLTGITIERVPPLYRPSTALKKT
jgi:hypothetical protein